MIDKLLHLGLAGIWPAIILYARNYSPESLPGMLEAQASVIFLTFLVSSGGGTLIRIYKYSENNIGMYSLYFYSILVSSIIFIIDLIVKTPQTEYLFYGALLAFSSLLVNEGVAGNDSVRLRLGLFLNIFFILSLVYSEVFWNYVSIDIEMVVNIVLLLVCYYIINRRCRFKMAEVLSALKSAIIKGVELMIRTLPLRLMAYLFAIYFVEKSGSDVLFIYTDAIIYYGVVSVFIGRYLLFEERKRIASLRELGGLALAIGLIFSIPFIAWEFTIGNIDSVLDFVYGLSIVIFISQRETYGIVTNFYNSHSANIFAFLVFILCVIQYCLMEYVGYMGIYLTLAYFVFFALTFYFAFFADRKSK